MLKIEVLADAIVSRSGYLDPLSPLYSIRNPGGLRAFVEKHDKDPLGFRVFKHHIDGYRALIYDLEKKCSGESNSGLHANSPLKELAYVFNLADGDVRNMMKYLRKALQDPDLTENIPISFFLE